MPVALSLKCDSQEIIGQKDTLKALVGKKWYCVVNGKKLGKNDVVTVSVAWKGISYSPE